MTTGLTFTPINSNTAYSVSKGTASDAVVIIPVTHNGLSVTEISGFAGYTNMAVRQTPGGLLRLEIFDITVYIILL